MPEEQYREYRDELIRHLERAAELLYAIGRVRVGYWRSITHLDTVRAEIVESEDARTPAADKA